MLMIREELSYDMHQDSLPNAAWRDLNFIPLPHNNDYELDLHRPYIDQYPLFDDQGNQLKRVKEVMDVWFDSGAMPFAQDGYPFKTDKVYFPADYISEGLDQTRGWFYTLHAVSALLGYREAYKNVICLGMILDKDNQKMSKSRGNIVSPWDMCEKYGADALRFWMYSVNQPGDSKNFDEKTVDEVVKKVFNLLRNVYAFYDLYRVRTDELNYEKQDLSKNPLDIWIMARLNQLVILTTDSLDAYSLCTPARAIREFIDELSTWYLRRSRESLRTGDSGSHRTLYHVLKTLAKIMAPFTPFIAEELWQELRNKNDVQSVHLDNWPTPVSIPEAEFVLESMESVRKLVAIGHAIRKDKNIPTRQPLLSISTEINIPEEYVFIVCDELNVRSVVKSNKSEMNLEINSELKSEGNFRELIRYVQDSRKKLGLAPKDSITITFNTMHEEKEFIEKWKKSLMEEVTATDVVFDSTITGEMIEIDNMKFVINIK